MLTARKFFEIQENFQDHAGVTEESLNRDFFSKIKFDNGIYKTTKPGRFDDLNEIVFNFLQTYPEFPRTFLDVGVSSGITTLEFYNRMKEGNDSLVMTGTDSNIRSYLMEIFSFLRVLVDKSGAPLQYDILGIPFRPWVKLRDYFTGYFLVCPIFNALFSFWKKKTDFSAVLDPPRSTDRTKSATIKKQLKYLLSPRALHQSRIKFVEHDIARNEGVLKGVRFDFIRVANLFNIGYFQEAQLRVMVDNIRENLLHPGSLLLVCRSEHDDSNHGTLFQLNGTEFTVLKRIGKGSEVENIICP